MTTPPPITVGETEWDRGLWWMVLVSGGLHLVALGLLLLIPHTFLHHPPPLKSYTVDLVAPDKVGGTNMVRGGKGREAARPMVAAEPKVEPPKPPPPKVEAKPVEPPQPPPQAVAKPVPPPEPKVQERPKGDEMALAEKVKTIEPPRPPTVAPAVPTAPAVATAAPRKPQPTVSPTIDVQAAKAAAAKAAKDAAAAKAAKAAKEAAEAKAAKAAKEAAEAKAAKQAADAKAAKEAADAKTRDARIAAAIKRVESQSGAHGGGTGDKPGAQPGGSISVGPGEGAGGVVMGVEYLLYYNMLQSRIKESWAWAGTNPSLEAVVRFNISESGEVMNVRITKPSGDAGFDASVERAVRSLNPLPPPPEKYRQQFSDVEVPFSLAQLKH